MATADVHCPQCDVDATFTYPDDTAPGTGLWWEHGCPAYDADGNPITPYRAQFTVPGD